MRITADMPRIKTVASKVFSNLHARKVPRIKGSMPTVWKGGLDSLISIQSLFGSNSPQLAAKKVPIRSC